MQAQLLPARAPVRCAWVAEELQFARRLCRRKLCQHHFLSHVLPKGFRRTRHYGRFASSNRTETMEVVRKLLDLAPPVDAQTSQTDPAQPLAHPCPHCGGRMIIIDIFAAGCQPRYRPTTPPAVIRIDTS